MGHSQFTGPSTAAKGTTVTDNRTTSVVLRNPRMTNRSTNHPYSGQPSPSTISNASGVGHPHPKRNCQ